MILNLHEMFILDLIHECRQSSLGGFPVWSIVLGFVSHVLLVSIPSHFTLWIPLVVLFPTIHNPALRIFFTHMFFWYPFSLLPFNTFTLLVDSCGCPLFVSGSSYGKIFCQVVISSANLFIYCAIGARFLKPDLDNQYVMTPDFGNQNVTPPNFGN